MSGQCAFCRIVDGRADAPIVDEREHAIAFLDQNPVVEGHTLVVPTTHRSELLTADDAVVAAVVRTVTAIATAMEGVLEPDGFSTFYTTGSLVGNVEHAHVHLLPRSSDDGIEISLSRDHLGTEEETRLANRLAAEVRGNS